MHAQPPAMSSSRLAPPAAEDPALVHDLGRPQRAIFDLVAAGAFRGDVLDAACGTGEHALLLAAHGLGACGVDDSPAAIARAGRKAQLRGLAAEFVVADLLDLGSLGRRFDCAVDAGMLNRCQPRDRVAWARSLHAALAPGARLYTLCIGDHERGPGGPPRVSQAELRALFCDGFTVERIDDARFESVIFPGGANGWLARVKRL
jgi:SAM-dependent methyltransferase